MSIKTVFNKASLKIKKHSPAILTGVGIVGLGATAYYAYKSREKVEKVVIDIEEKRDSGEEINKVEVAKDIAEAVYQPVVIGAFSITCILMAHKIQSNRIKALVGALAAQQAQNMYFEHKYRQVHGDEAYQEFMVPTQRVEEEEVGKNGKTKTVVKEVAADIDRTIGQWFRDSDEYASDDHSYNIAYIDSINEKMQTILFQRGSLLLNEVREALGFERIRNGALLGWTTSDSFEIEKVVTMLGQEELGEMKEQIWVTWTRPRYIYEEVDFNGRYNPFN